MTPWVGRARASFSIVVRIVESFLYADIITGEQLDVASPTSAIIAA
jgi:hypothetical protein